jgi:hypothetical protein
MFENDHDGVGAVAGLARWDQQFDPDSRRQLEDIADWYFFVLLGLAVPGLVLAARRAPRAIRWLVGANFLGLLLVPLTLYGNPRFHVPLAPFGAIAAAATVVAVLGAVGGRRRGTAELRVG